MGHLDVSKREVPKPGQTMADHQQASAVGSILPSPAATKNSAAPVPRFAASASYSVAASPEAERYGYLATQSGKMQWRTSAQPQLVQKRLIFMDTMRDPTSLVSKDMSVWPRSPKKAGESQAEARNSGKMVEVYSHSFGSRTFGFEWF